MKTRINWLVTISAVLGLPLLAAYLKFGDVGFLLSFPPELDRLDHFRFRPKLTAALLLGCLGVPIVWQLTKRRDRIYRHSLVLQRRHFPWWGWAGYLFLAISWIVAWTRIEKMSSIQIYTFTPIWLGFIVVINAHIHRRSNQAPIYRDRLRFGILFIVSALFWWIFEYLNRFTENWIYVGPEAVSAAHYYIHGSICFSTVLPAMYSLFRLFDSYDALHRQFYCGPKWSSFLRKGLGGCLLILGVLGLLGVGWFPRFFYAFLWLGPLLIFGGLQMVIGSIKGLRAWSRGDWRWVAFWGLSGLVCGFFWELWNMFSFLRWEYQISFFYGWKLFEMPILGYLGYIPFGVFCGLACQWVVGKDASIQFSPNE